MKRLVKKTLLILASILITFVIFMAGVTYWILNHPQSAWNFASRYLLPQDLKVSWEEIHFDWQKKSWRDWDFEWSTKNLNISKAEPSIDIGVVSAKAQFGLHLWTNRPTFEFEQLALQTREDSIFKVTPSKEPSAEQSFYQTANTFLGYLSKSNQFLVFKKIDLQLANLQLHMDGPQQWNLSGAVVKNPVDQSHQEIQVQINAQSDQLTAQVKGVLDGSLLESKSSFLNLVVDVKAKEWSLEGVIKGIFENENLTLESAPKMIVGSGAKPIVILPSLLVNLSQEALHLKTEVQASGLPGPIVRLDKVTAKLQVPLENDVMWSSKATAFDAYIPVDLFLIDKNMRAPLEKACRCQLPEEFHGVVEGKFWLDQFFSKNELRQKVGESKLKFESVKNKLFSADVAADVDIFKKENTWSFEPRLDADIQVYSFQGLRRFLDAKGVIIPAPLDILEGTIQLSAKSPVAQQENNLHTSVQLLVNLKSPTQEILADAAIVLDLANNFKSLDVDVDAVLRSVKLDLPPLDPVLGIPSLASDSRILRKAPDKTPSKFKLNVVSRLRTEKPGSIQFSSQYAKPHVPISVLVNSVGSTSTGFVRLEPFSVNYLRRQIHVEKVNISLAKNEEEDLPLEGRFRIEQGGYKIFINVSGTVQSPNVLLTSDPSLPKNDIISVLLYGRVASQLVSNEAETAGNVNAAVTDRAVGMFGLWAFASTPIQSFSYNATTKVYTATVDLGNGVSAGVGTNWEQATNFELRKRVSSRWMLTATWAPNQNNRQEGRLVLQWEKRF